MSFTKPYMIVVISIALNNPINFTIIIENYSILSFELYSIINYTSICRLLSSRISNNIIVI